MELIPAIQTYQWGIKGSKSLVAKLALTNGIAVSEDENYAELWMGTHLSGPSQLKLTNKSLAQHIQEMPSALGSKVQEKFSSQLPFLLKVLSVGKALSIQAHPNKAHAKELHAKRPDLYKDDNHKPEMAIALTKFEMLCGFRPVAQIFKFIKDVPELRDLIGDGDTQGLDMTENNSHDEKKALQTVFTKLMKAEQAAISVQLSKLLQRISGMDTQEKLEIEAELIQRLSTQFPNDIGIFCVFFLQHFTLEPGQAVFLPANEPHAYLYGDCIECMATSDNVVRAGLTPKFKDVDTLCEMLTYTNGLNWIIDGTPLPNGNGYFYDPPVDEFAVAIYKSKDSFSLQSSEGSCSMVLCIQGEGLLRSENGNLSLKPGTVIFVPADLKANNITILPEGTTELTLCDAYVS